MIRWSSALANASRISQYYRAHCFLCEGERGSLEHFLLDCPSLSDIRSLFESKIAELQSVTQTRKERVKMIIGNINDIKTCSIMRKALLLRIEFVDKMIVQRYLRVREKSRLNSHEQD